MVGDAGAANAPGIGFHWWITRVKGGCGSMVRATWLGTNPKSRHGPGGLRRLQVVSPGGNGHGVADRLFRQQGDGELAVRPRLGAFVVVFGQASQLHRRPEAPEDRPDLPSGAVPPQHLRSCKGRFGEGGEHDSGRGSPAAAGVRNRGSTARPAHRHCTKRLRSLRMFPADGRERNPVRGVPAGSDDGRARHPRKQSPPT